ncbi:MAG: mannose-1-phosphate guanylyltransferase/mannose-6-phosphate isomerase [Betaproteobacteria bacterium TMED82]|nr:MAG: mannose-1-phosphate guanylyltransferase/mannose-6-phosphate isomerase [Betaproteobacteria bacterium TMED82]|tara:strand:- start:7195 stop:8637 length:1443 start_codon:yes stop_codon:yes gene_type:complete
MGKRIRFVILCGGSGCRLWPLSRKAFPKQFVPLFNGKSLLQVTLERVGDNYAKDFFESKGFTVADKLLCIGSSSHFHQILHICNLARVDVNLILEPYSKNTCAAMGSAAICSDLEEVLIFCPSDHYIPNRDSYLASIKEGLDIVGGNRIVALGVKPSFPSSAYGYVVPGERIGGGNSFVAKKFVEKPDSDGALKLIEEDGAFWNAGSFMAQSAAMQETIKNYEPRVFESVGRALAKGHEEKNCLTLNPEEFKTCPEISIDHAVIEKHDDLYMVSLDSAWSDVGSWNALSELFKPDAENNRSVGEAYFFESSDSFVYSSGRLVTTLGIKNTAIIETADVIFVVNLDLAEKVKDLVKILEKEDIVQIFNHQKVNRPWGVFHSIDRGDRFQVKRIVVKPGGRLSLQRHKKRAEHWVVVKGRARVTREHEVFELGENESTYIPIGSKHRLENPYQDPLEIIEVQSGTYLGEDDIERFEDVYGRQ